MEAIIFCGIQATGKTTLFRQNFFRTHVWISRDLLNTQNKENKFIETCLITQQPFVIDNTNPTKAQRKSYIDRAKEKKFRIIGYYFQSKLEEAMERNQKRKGKENIPEVGIKGTYSKMELPDLTEGFDELYYVYIQEDQFIIEPWNNEI